MNRRAFFASPLALLPLGAPIGMGAAAEAMRTTVINVGVSNVAGAGAGADIQTLVRERVIPAIRAAIENDIVIIAPGSRQAELLR